MLILIFHWLLSWFSFRSQAFEDNIRKNRSVISNWLKYAQWEESQREIQRYDVVNGIKSIVLPGIPCSTRYCISPNNSHPLINHLPWIIARPHPSHHLLFLVSPPCQDEVESVIQNNWSVIMTIQALTLRILTLKISQGTKLEHLESPSPAYLMWSFFWYKTKYLGHNLQWAKCEIIVCLK